MQRPGRAIHSASAVVLRVAATAVASIAVLGHGPQSVAAAGPIVPDSSCSTESTFKSTAGDTGASLQVFNKSPETVKVWWLDYTGKRVFYQELPPFTQYVQGTFLTHPWVITNVAGQCYRFLVMTSQLQAVTVEGEPPDPNTTTVPFAAASNQPPVTPPPATRAPATRAPTAGAPTGAPSAGTVPSAPAGSPAPAGSATSGSGSSALVVVVAVAAVAIAAGAGLAATGRLPGVRRRGR